MFEKKINSAIIDTISQSEWAEKDLKEFLGEVYKPNHLCHTTAVAGICELIDKYREYMSSDLVDLIEDIAENHNGEFGDKLCIEVRKVLCEINKSFEYIKEQTLSMALYYVNKDDKDNPSVIIGSICERFRREFTKAVLEILQRLNRLAYDLDVAVGRGGIYSKPFSK